uniref:AlNc14C545G12112 protein n=1 Tax=Albugo laibachii Nc14 TaxID=890382 RepID=F0WF96_9STRA|nr:AlNc14C81G5288 [Albugo laibachii Nc14]CCA27474.1 AlNc14C545G12112 [Albugo laibachii Nc14]|eukprot:CCA27474.1 AlNc14C545G12112 [Albugo laibachii Nc14]
MCLYFKKDKDELITAVVYVDDLFVTGTSMDALDKFFKEMSALEIKDLGAVSKFIGLQFSLDEKVGYVLDQEVSINLLLKENGLGTANGVRAPIFEECNNYKSQEPEYLPLKALNGNASVKEFHSLVDSKNALAYYGRLEDGEAYLKVLGGDQDVKVADRWRCSIA